MLQLMCEVTIQQIARVPCTVRDDWTASTLFQTIYYTVHFFLFTQYINYFLILLKLSKG